MIFVVTNDENEKSNSAPKKPFLRHERLLNGLRGVYVVVRTDLPACRPTVNKLRLC